MSASRKSSAERGAVTSAMTCTSSADLNLRAFSFENQSSYDANRELTRLRDINFRLRPPSKDDDIWKRPPPDFRPQCFEPRPPKRNSREAMKPWRYTDEKDDNTSPPNSATSQTPMSLPELMKPKSAEEKDFTLKFHIMDSAESKADFVTTGMFPAGPFKNPKIHDHRPYPTLKSLGLPEFDTSFDADPFDIRFKSQRLGVITGLSRGIPPERDIKGPQMNPPLKQPPKWEARLHLPTESWPTPVAQYSRFRPFWRSAQTVLLDRMEQALSTKWKEEKMQSLKNVQRRIRERPRNIVQCSE